MWPAWARSSWWCPRRAANATRWCWRRRGGRREPRLHHRRRAGRGGALAHGTATVPAVDKITGPGNAYVASAKRRVFGKVGIDMIAGPAKSSCWPTARRRPTGWRWTCSARPSTTSWRRASCCARTPAYIAKVKAEIDRLLPGMPRREVIRASLEGRGALIHTRSMEEACAISNRIAPGAPGGVEPRPASLGAAARTPARSSSAPSPARAWATTAPGPTTCCRPRARRASPRRWGCTTSRSAAA